MRPTTTQDNRRPLKVRSNLLAIQAARWLTRHDVSPNAISMTSIVFAALGGGALAMRPLLSGTSEAFSLVLAALFIQGRLLCNLFDGMVAMEGGKQTPAGALFNEAPDRVADVLILVGAGYAVAQCPMAVTLAWAAALLAVMTAYVRVLGVSLGMAADFRGPMAKQHRMAAMTLACLLSVAEPMVAWHGEVMVAGLVLITIGCVITLCRRTSHLYLNLNRPS